MRQIIDDNSPYWWTTIEFLSKDRMNYHKVRIAENSLEWVAKYHLVNRACRAFFRENVAFARQKFIKQKFTQ